MKKKILCLLFVLMFIFLNLSIISATYLPHKQRTDFNLIISSNNATYCNLSYIQFPDGSRIITDLALARSGTSFYHNISANNFSQIGSTCFGITCYDGSIYDTGSVCREVTADGFIGTLGFNFLILLLSAGVIVLGFTIKDAPITILGSFGLTFIGIRILYYGIDVIKDPVYTWALGIIILMLAAYISIRSTYELITSAE